LSNETTRRNAENRRGRRVAEIEQEPVAPSVDEDAAAFLQEAAEAAAAAALEAEALASEVEDDAVAAAPSVDEPMAVAAEVLADEVAAAGELAAEMAAELASESVDGPMAEAAEALADEVPGAEELAAEMAVEPAAESVDRPMADDAFEAELAAAEAAVAAAEAGGDDAPAADPSEAATLEAFAREEERALDAEMVRELSEEAPTAEEQALAQAEEERDPDDELGPADIAEVDDEFAGSFEKLAAKARRLSEEQARNIVHSILFVTDKPITVEQLRNATGLEPQRIKDSLERLAGDLREGISGVVLSDVAGGWQLRTAPESAEYVRRFLHVKPRRLTRAALETLAIIAYRQPVTRPEIEDIRGVDCGAVVKALLDWKLIKILGKKDEVGRPLLYGTSREFLEFFQLKDLASLPTLREFHELNEESVQIVEEELGPEAAASIAGTVAELTDPAYLEAERERIAKSEQALAELEQALADAEAKSSDVQNTIAPPKEPEEAPPENS